MSEFQKKVVQYYDLGKQIKLLENIRKKLKDYIKDKLKEQKKKLVNIGKHRVALSIYKSKSLDKEKLNNKLNSINDDINNYYIEDEKERLDVVEIEKNINMEDISND